MVSLRHRMVSVLELLTFVIVLGKNKSLFVVLKANRRSAKAFHGCVSCLVSLFFFKVPLQLCMCLAMFCSEQCQSSLF